MQDPWVSHDPIAEDSGLCADAIACFDGCKGAIA